MTLATVDPHRQAFQAAVREFRKKVTENADYVGNRFAEEARKIHFEEAPARGIYGEATPEEARGACRGRRRLPAVAAAAGGAELGPGRGSLRAVPCPTRRRSGGRRMGESTGDETVASYSFAPDDLKVDARRPGISAFMRIKNGADFLEAAIRSHIDLLDEVVAVHNQCTDRTADILARLRAEYGGERLRVIAYLPEVFPPGSTGHAAEPATSPRSFVNMSNLALARTRFRVAVKLDDDHLAMRSRFAALAQSVRDQGYRLRRPLNLAGLNLACDETGQAGILAREPFTASGGRFLFEVTPRTYFTRDRRFERMTFERRRVFGDIACWHLKYLKPDFGFGNRGIDLGNPRFARRRAAFLAERSVVGLSELKQLAPPWSTRLAWSLLSDKGRLRADRWRRLLENPPTQAELEQALAFVAAWRQPATPGNLPP